jgi:hypothetical protein
LSLNAHDTPSKFSTVEKRLNKMILGVFLFKMLIISLLTVGAAIFYQEYNYTDPYLSVRPRIALRHA